MQKDILKYFLVSSAITVFVVGFVLDKNTATFTLVIALLFVLLGLSVKFLLEIVNMKTFVMVSGLMLPPVLYFTTPYVFKFIAKTFHLKVIFM